MKTNMYVSIANTLGFLGPLAFGLCTAGANAADSPVVLTPTYGPNDGPPLLQEEFMIPAADPGIELYVRNKHRVDITTYTPDEILLFVHGATYPAETAFDLMLDGMSWTPTYPATCSTRITPGCSTRRSGALSRYRKARIR
jgi:hypothetical protein